MPDSTTTPVDPLRRLRHTMAAAVERLRALELPDGEAETARAVGCAALGLLSTVLFVSGTEVSSRVPAELVEDEIRKIAEMLSLVEPAQPALGAVQP